MSHAEIWMKNFKPYYGNETQWFGPNTYACCGGDLVVTQFFWKLGMQKPSYLDVGAHHPFDISNTALLYSRGSRGVNVEANPKLMAEFEKHRPEDINVCVGVAPTEGMRTFYMWDDMSGRNTCSPEWARRMDKVGGTREVHCVTLNQVVDKYCGGKFPDFLSIDIEGLDFEVLDKVDFSKSSPMVVCVESLQDEVAGFTNLMDHHGYKLLIHLAIDLIFVRKDLVRLHE